MDNCILPIELIEVICGYDYTNWLALILTCTQICKKLMPLRWDAKNIMKCVDMINCNLPETAFQVSMKGKNGGKRCLYAILRDDYWRIYGIWYMTDSIMNDESINFSEESINSIFYYKNDTCVGSYVPGKGCGRRYQIITSSEASGILYITKTEMMARLDDIGVKYTWLKYIEHEN